MSTDDSSFDLPYFDKLEIDMYSNKDLYADNSGARIYSDYDYSVGQYNYPVRMQNKYNGLSMNNGHGFSVDLPIEPTTIEMFFTPTGSQNVLFSSDSSSIKWSADGTLTKSGIYKIYVNGIDRTSETNKSTFLLNDISHHILVVLDDPASNIKFNQNQLDTEYGSANTYSNIAFYEQAFTSSEALDNYRLYCSDTSVVVENPAIVISESSTGLDETAYFIRSFDDQSV
jgi:hypothetical protein